MEVYTYTEFLFHCTKCGEKKLQTNLIEGKFLECWNCSQRYIKDEDGVWQELKETDGAIALRKAGKG